jgi:hypothetical protein
MPYFTSVQPTQHYLKYHLKDIPPEEVTKILLETKNPRKNGDIYQIETDKYFIVFAIKNAVAYIINAKRK